MLEKPRPLEEVDPETAQLFMDVCHGRLHAFVLGDRVFQTTGPGPKQDLRDRIINEVILTAGRNDPCPCGSGKKYKKCCGKMGL